MAISREEFEFLLRDLREDDLLDFCRKYVIHGSPHVFDGKDNDYYDFKKKIAEKYRISHNDIYMTGSGKMGFSLREESEFSADSDIDIAIVSGPLFDEFMEIAREYQMQLRQSRRAVTEKDVAMYHSFLEYTALGWIRPDKLPISFRVKDFKNDWFEFFRSISYGNSEVGNYKVSGGVFRSERHLELYIVSGVQSVFQGLKLKAVVHDKSN